MRRKRKKKKKKVGTLVWFLCEEQQLLSTPQWSLAILENEEAQVSVNRPDFDQ